MPSKNILPSSVHGHVIPESQNPEHAYQEMKAIAGRSIPLAHDAIDSQDFKRLRDLFAEIDLSSFPVNVKILFEEADFPNPHIPNLVCALETKFLRGGDVPTNAGPFVRVELPFPGRFAHLAPPHLVKLAMDFVSDILIHELRESTTFRGETAFNPHWTNNSDPNPDWVWTGPR